MNTAPTGRCQSAPGPAFHAAQGWWRVLLAIGLLLLARTVAAEDAPPGWQRDIEAAHTLETTLAFAPSKDPAVTEARRQKLGQLYSQLLVHYPDQAEVQKSAAVYYDSINQYDPALFCWQHAAALDPQDAATADALGAAWMQRGRIKDAVLQFDRAVNTQPTNSAYHFDLANVLYLFRQELLDPPKRPDEQAILREALEHFRRAAELAPGSLQMAQAYAETFYIFAHPDWEQALAAWKAVLNLSGQNKDFANGHLARVSLRLRRPQDMETYLDRIQDPAFDTLKAKFRQQAAALPSTTPAAPTAPAATPQ